MAPMALRPGERCRPGGPVRGSGVRRRRPLFRQRHGNVQHVVFAVLDQVDLSDEGKEKVRRWRGDHIDGTAEMSELTVQMNEVIGSVLDERTQRLIRRKGRYISTGGNF